MRRKPLSGRWLAVSLWTLLVLASPIVLMEVVREHASVGALHLASLALVVAAGVSLALRPEASADRRGFLERHVERSPDVFFRFRLQPRFSVEFISASVTKLTGWEPEAFGADASLVRRIVHPEDRPLVGTDGGHVTRWPSLRLRGVHRDGSTFWMELHQRVESDGEGRPVLLEGMVRDVTRVRQTEAALRESERALRSLRDNIPGLVYRCRFDEGHAFERVSEAARSLLGRTPAAVEGGAVKLLDVVHPQDRTRVAEVLDGARAQRRGYSHRFRIVGANGELRWVWDCGVVVADASGGVVAVEGIWLDETERRRVEDERGRLLDEAQAALVSREDFLAMATHDLRAPLTGMKLNVQRQLRRLERGQTFERADATACLMQLHEQVERMHTLVDDLLDVSRARAGQLDIQRQDVDLGALVRDVVGRMRANIEASGCAVQVAAALPLVGRWDRLRLEQVVTNLLSNALKYGAGRPVEIAVEGDAGVGRLRVRDQGAGLSADDRARLFRQFERLTAEHRVGSTGLGLWIVRRIVEALGGTIRCESAGHGQGSCFIVELPRQEPAGEGQVQAG